MNQPSDEQFEEDVRGIAAQLFPGASTKSGRYYDGRERDGVYDYDDTVHIIEITTSRKKEKIENDIKKSIGLVASIRKDKPSHNVKIWIVTYFPPTADQEIAAIEGRKKARCPVEILSYSKFYSKLFDAREFIQLRQNYPFGSIRNPTDGTTKVPESEYIEIGFFEKNTNKTRSPKEISQEIKTNPVRSIFLGDYGSGKSMALRYFYNSLANAFNKGLSQRFPIYLNLRDHFGQSDPAEALMRHANKIGLNNPNRLIGAWRAGFADIILDGFDELSPAQFSSTSKNLRLARRAAAELVSQFVIETPLKGSILISGRRHYFDSATEMNNALNVDENWRIYDLNEFTDKQIEDYLKQKGKFNGIPSWLPKRPLLIGYLAAWSILNDISDVSLTAAQGWDYLLDRICDREVRQIPGGSIEASSLRLLLERLATYARSFESGRGPIPSSKINSEYESIFNQPPDDRTTTLLLRLPGLASSPGQENIREFIDEDFADACRQGDVSRFLHSPFSDIGHFSSLQVELGSVGTDSVAEKSKILSSKQVSAAISRAADEHLHLIATDLIRASIVAEISYSGPPLIIRDIHISNIELYSDQDYSNITFQECWIESAELYSGGDAVTEKNLPQFKGCVISSLGGVKGVSDVPKNKLDDSNIIESYRGLGASNAAILMSDMPISVSVLLTILKKTFFQAGGGRLEAALYRGLDHRAKSYVSEVLNILSRYGFLKQSNRAGSTVWIPDKTKVNDAIEIRDSPMTSKHLVLKEVRAL